jgi:CRP-like cAMP-binding protein
MFSCLALTDLELLVIDKKDFKKIFFRSFPGLGTIFIQEMNLNFERLEYIMEMIYESFFPDESYEGINKLNLVHKEKIMLSRISSQKNSISNGKIVIKI